MVVPGERSSYTTPPDGLRRAASSKIPGCDWREVEGGSPADGERRGRERTHLFMDDDGRLPTAESKEEMKSMREEEGKRSFLYPIRLAFCLGLWFFY